MRAGIPEDDYQFFDWHSAITEAKAESGSVAEIGLRCQDCNKIKPDVHKTICPYAEDVHGEEIPITICDECRHQRAMDI